MACVTQVANKGCTLSLPSKSGHGISQGRLQKAHKVSNTNCIFEQCYGSVINRIPDLGSQIPDPKIVTKERGEKNLLVYLFLLPQISQNWKLFIFERTKKKIWANLQGITELFTQKLSLTSQKYRFGIRDQEKTYPGSRFRGQKGTGSRIRIRNTIFKKYIWQSKLTHVQPPDSAKRAVTADPDCGGRLHPEFCREPPEVAPHQAFQGC